MGVITLPANIEQDRQNNVKASSVHVQGNFDALLNAVNRKLEIDGSMVPIADLPMGSHKITQLGLPTTSADATTKGYVDSALLLKANLASPAFTGTPTAPTVSSVTDNSGKIATTKFIVDVLKAIYPVGSVYIGTQSTCPMATIIPGSTWTIVSTNLVTSVNTSATVAGNGNVLGFTSGANIAYMHSQNESLGSQAGWLRSYVNGGLSTVGDMKVTTNAANSGLTATVTRSNLTVNVWRRTA